MRKGELPYLVTYDRREHEGEAAPVAAFACKGDAEDFAANLSQTPIVTATAGMVIVSDRRTGGIVWSAVHVGASLPSAVRS